MEVGRGAGVGNVAREQVGRIGAGGIGGEFGSQIRDGGDGAGGEFALGVAFADDNFGADVAFGVENIPLVEGDGFGDPTGGVEADGKQGAISGGIDGEALIKQQLNLSSGEDFGLPVAIYFHGFPPSVIIFIQPRFGGEGQAGRGKIKVDADKDLHITTCNTNRWVMLR